MKMNAIREAKKSRIEDYFKNSFMQMRVFSNSKDVSDLFQRLVKYHKDTKVSATGNYSVTTSEYQQIYSTHGALLNRFQEDSGYYDVFVICAKHGHVMYSAARESDLGENLGHGRYKNTGLADLWNKVVRTGKPAVVKMAPYAPSNDEPAMFAGYPIRDSKGSLIGLVAFQIPLDQINRIMNERTGMGKTGESYLVGADQLMRSDSFLDPTHHSVKASFRNPVKGKVATEASIDALAGKTNTKVVVDYNGNPVLSSYTSIKIGDIIWGLLVEIDVAEAFSPVDANGEEFFAKYVELYGYYDLFLVNPNGYIFYTAAKESD
ncbi:MAG: hypothetical protein GY866_03580, partial [Proteobacteria bacterium]|nr:hypothetical protein [Pseudomonadota bacterium]